MTNLFQMLAERLKAMFLTKVGLELEGEFIEAEAERRAKLLRQAATYEEEGLTEVADNLRKQASNSRVDQPLATVESAIVYLQREPTKQLAAPESRTDPDSTNYESETQTTEEKPGQQVENTTLESEKSKETTTKSKKTRGCSQRAKKA